MGNSQTGASTDRPALLRAIAAKVRQGAGDFKEDEPLGDWKVQIALGALFKEAYEAGAWQRDGSQIGDRLKRIMAAPGRDRQTLLEYGLLAPAWMLEAYSAVVGPLVDPLTPLDGEKENLEFEAGMAADEIEEEAKRIEAGEFTVTLKDLRKLTGGFVAVKTIQNRQNRGELPAVVGKRGREELRRYSDMLTWWQDKNFEAPLPDERTARERLSVKR